MSINVTDFAQLTDELQTIYAEHSENAIAEAVGLKVFDVGETALLNFEHQVLHGISGVERIADGQDLPRLNTEEGKVIALYKSFLINWGTPNVFKGEGNPQQV